MAVVTLPSRQLMRADSVSALGKIAIMAKHLEISLKSLLNDFFVVSSSSGYIKRFSVVVTVAINMVQREKDHSGHPTARAHWSPVMVNDDSFVLLSLFALRPANRILVTLVSTLATFPLFFAAFIVQFTVFKNIVKIKLGTAFKALKFLQPFVFIFSRGRKSGGICLSVLATFLALAQLRFISIAAASTAFAISEPLRSTFALPRGVLWIFSHTGGYDTWQ